jgi:hypothetical protein
MDFGSVPGCGVHKDESGLKGAAGVEFITEYTSVPLVGGLGEQVGGLSLTPWNSGLCRSHRRQKQLVFPFFFLE